MFKETNKELNEIRKAMDDMKEEFNKKKNTGEDWVWNADKKKHSKSNLKKKNLQNLINRIH